MEKCFPHSYWVGSRPVYNERALRWDDVVPQFSLPSIQKVDKLVDEYLD